MIILTVIITGVFEHKITFGIHMPLGENADRSWDTELLEELLTNVVVFCDTQTGTACLHMLGTLMKTNKVADVMK